MHKYMMVKPLRKLRSLTVK